MTMYDAIVIGTGQAGPALARRLAGAGMKVAIIERGRFGGTCVNTGCTPTKTLVASAYAVHTARRGADYGFAIGGEVTVDMKKVKARKDYVAGLSNKGVERSMKKLENGTVYEGQARFVSPHEVMVGTETLSAEKIFINVGGRAAVPDIPGLDQVDYLTNSSMLGVDFLPRHLLVLGGSYIGLEFGQMYRRFGSEVTIVEIGPRLIPREDEDVSQAVAAFLGREGIEIRTNARCLKRRQAGRRDRHEAPVRRRAARGQRLPSAHCGRTAPQHRRSRPRPRRREAGRPRLHRSRRRAAHQRAGHLGAG